MRTAPTRVTPPISFGPTYNFFDLVMRLLDGDRTLTHTLMHLDLP